MRLNDFIEGLQILKKYFDDPNGYHIGAEHDQFYVYGPDKVMPPEDVQRLRDLDWFQPQSGGDAEYDPNNGWSAWT